MTNLNTSNPKIIPSWYNKENTVYRYDFTHGWTWDDLIEAIATGRQQISQRGNQHPVAVILTLPQTINVPPSAISMMDELLSNRPPDVTFTCIVTPSILVKVLWNSFMMVHPETHSYFQHVGNIEQALTLITNHFASHTTPSIQSN